jgi:hypothetical protein
MSIVGGPLSLAADAAATLTMMATVATAVIALVSKRLHTRSQPRESIAMAKTMKAVDAPLPAREFTAPKIPRPD